MGAAAGFELWTSQVAAVMEIDVPCHAPFFKDFNFLVLPSDYQIQYSVKVF